jgi:hypothetical protein
MKTSTYQKKYGFHVVPQSVATNFSGNPRFLAIRDGDEGDEIAAGRTEEEATKNAVKTLKFFSK